MKNKTESAPKKSAAAEKLGGQPESDRDAREAGVASATATHESGKEPERGCKRDLPRT